MPNNLSVENKQLVNKLFYEKFFVDLTKNFSYEDYVQNFLSFIKENFCIHGAFACVVSKDKDLIYSLNIPKIAIEKNIDVFKKMFSKKSFVFINKKIWGYNTSFYIPFYTNQEKILFSFFSNNEGLKNLKIQKDIINFSQKFIKALLSYDLKTKLCLENKELDNFLLNLKKILPCTSPLNAIIKSLNSLIEDINILKGFFIYKISEENDENAKLIGFKSKEEVYIKGHFVKKEKFIDILENENFVVCNELLKDILSFNNSVLDNNNALSCLLSLNEVENLIVIFLVDKGVACSLRQKFLEKIFYFLQTIVLISENKRQLAEYEKQKSISFLSSGMLHYFNNFFQSVQTRLELISLKTKNDEKILKDVSQIKNRFLEASNFLKNLSYFINNDLSYCRNFSFADFIYEIYDNFQEKYGDVIDLEINNLDVDYEIFASREKLGRAILEILQNSIDFATSKNPNIKMTVKYFSQKNSKIRHFLRLYIDDIGSGISKENLPFVFEPFFSTKGLDKNTKISVNLFGLGLPLARSIINSIGGFIDIVSVEGKGTRVKIYIPVSKA